MTQIACAFFQRIGKGLLFSIGLSMSMMGLALASSPDSLSLKAVSWSDVPGWGEDGFIGVWEAWNQSCQSLQQKPEWQSICYQAKKYQEDPLALKAFMESVLEPYEVTVESRKEGLVTGYYEPLLMGSRQKTDEYRYPIYKRPSDLLVADPPFYVENFEVPISRMKQAGSEEVPYDTRGDLMDPERLKGHELVWVADPIELFFLQVQGSGRVLLPNGQIIRVGYADHNGYPYRSIGKVLIERGELKAHEASMQSIQKWAKDNPDRVDELLAQNPRFIFFQEHGPTTDPRAGPLGTLGVPLTPERSIAVDPNHIPLGLPVFLSTTFPNSDLPLRRLVFAQDTGNAIQGGLRADYFWGYGVKAEFLAGKMKEKGQFWVLLPRKSNGVFGKDRSF